MNDLDEPRLFIPFRYDEHGYPFRDWFEHALKTRDIEQLHILWEATPENYNRLYERFKNICSPHLPMLVDLVDDFVSGCVPAVLGEILGIQPVPTLRCHFSVSDKSLLEETSILNENGPEHFLGRYYLKGRRPGLFHRDMDYGLRLGSLNLWIPVTNTFETNGIWLGSPHHGGLDAVPLEVATGSCICFDGARQWHGTVWNTSGITRLSLDIRVFPRSAIEKMPALTSRLSL